MNSFAAAAELYQAAVGHPECKGLASRECISPARFLAWVSHWEAMDERIVNGHRPAKTLPEHDLLHGKNT